MRFHTGQFITMAVLVVSILGIGIFSHLQSGQLSRTVSEAMIMLIIVLGLFTYVGNSGVFSFGHVGFVMLGAYAQAWQTCCPTLKPITLTGLPDFLIHNTYPVWSSMLFSGLFGALIAIIVGLVLIRLSGLAAAIASFAFLSALSIVFSNMDKITGGTSSIVGIPPSLDVLEISALTTAVVVLVYAFKESRFGLMLRASREDYFAAKSSGIRIYHLRLVAFVISCFVCAIAGATYSHFLGVLSVDGFYISLTMLVIAMMVIGGQHSVTGCVVGVSFVTILNTVLRAVENGIQISETKLSIPSGSQQVMVGLVLLLVLIYRPSGLTRGKELGTILLSLFSRLPKKDSPRENN